MLIAQCVRSARRFHENGPNVRWTNSTYGPDEQPAAAVDVPFVSPLEIFADRAYRTDDNAVAQLAVSAAARLATDQTLIVTPMWLEAFRELAFPGRDLEMLRDPGLSPLYADLNGLPPAMFVVGALDPLLDDSLFMASRWQAAGNPATVEVWPVGAHTFMNMGTPLAEAALSRTTTWISEIFR